MAISLRFRQARLNVPAIFSQSRQEAVVFNERYNGITMRYLITFACYGVHLHGHESGSVDRHHNVYGSRPLRAEPQRVSHERGQMVQEPYLLDQGRRAAVLEAIGDVCLNRGWNLRAAHVRSTHVHVVMEADIRPEKVLNYFKSYASRYLNGLGMDEPDRRRWARHGSTRWLWKDEDVREAIRYVVEEQGEPMAVYLSEEI
ncbi:MAG TPA: transposase [Bryobacteraceae bacterium]|jgi:REP element-mobilizing transposase RayT|nr:transposase [Bryobacteraceae bacterium]